MPYPYLIPGTVVLQNKLGISDFDELEQAVADIGDAMAYRLFDKNTPVPPTLAGWRAVHKAMFGSVFEWAGDFRNVNIRKSGDDDSSDGLFAPSGRLVADGQRAVRNLENTVRRILTAKISLIADNLANLADVYDQLNYLHPFRERETSDVRTREDRPASGAPHRRNLNLSSTKFASEPDLDADRAAVPVVNQIRT